MMVTYADFSKNCPLLGIELNRNIYSVVCKIFSQAKRFLLFWLKTTKSFIDSLPVCRIERYVIEKSY